MRADGAAWVSAERAAARSRRCGRTSTRASTSCRSATTCTAASTGPRPAGAKSTRSTRCVCMRPLLPHASPGADLAGTSGPAVRQVGQYEAAWRERKAPGWTNKFVRTFAFSVSAARARSARRAPSEPTLDAPP